MTKHSNGSLQLVNCSLFVFDSLLAIRTKVDEERVEKLSHIQSKLRSFPTCFPNKKIAPPGHTTISASIFQ